MGHHLGTACGASLTHTCTLAASAPKEWRSTTVNIGEHCTINTGGLVPCNERSYRSAILGDGVIEPNNRSDLCFPQIWPSSWQLHPPMLLASGLLLETLCQRVV